MTLATTITHCAIILLFISGCESKEDPVIAEVGKEKIFLSEIDAQIKNSLYEYLFAIFDVRRIVLEELINDKVLKAESKTSKILPDSVLSAGISQVKRRISIDDYVKMNALQNGVVEEGNPFKLYPLDSPKGKLILEESYSKFARVEFLKSIRTKYSIKTFLEAPATPKLNLNGIRKHSRGKLNSALSISFISDFTCSVCQGKEKIFRALFEKYKDMVRFDHIHLSPSINKSIIFSECSDRQGKFWEAHDMLFSRNITDSSDVNDLISKLKLDRLECYQCMAEKSEETKLSLSMKKVRGLNIDVTPTVLINDRIYYGELSENAISATLDKQITKQEQ